MTKEITIEEIKIKILPILGKYGASMASIFGSVARGEATDESDVDILVELPEGSSLLDLAGLKIDIEEILSRSVDVLTYNSLHPLLRDRILSEQEPIICQNSQNQHFQV